MIAHRLTHEGTFPDVAYFADSEWVAAQVGPPAARRLHVWRDRQIVWSTPLPDGEAYPRIGMQCVWYRDGDDRDIACLDLTTLTRRTFTSSLTAKIHGTDPIAASDVGVAWQVALDGVVTVYLQPRDGALVTIGAGLPTGLSRVLDGRRVTFVDDERVQVTPAGLRTRPCWAADGAMAVEGPDDYGVELWAPELETWKTTRQQRVRVARLWPELQARTPRVVLAPDGTYRVATWAPSGGIHVATVASDDFRLFEPIVVPPTTPRPTPIPAPPRPPQEPEPMQIDFPPRDETRKFLASLEALYTSHFKRGARETHIDEEGVAVWMEGYLRRRVNGLDHDAAERGTLAEAWGAAAETKDTTNPFL